MLSGGDGPPDLVEVTLALAARCSSWRGSRADPAAALRDGSALRRYRAMVARPGRRPRRRPAPGEPRRDACTADARGIVTAPRRPRRRRRCVAARSGPGSQGGRGERHCRCRVPREAGRQGHARASTSWSCTPTSPSVSTGRGRRSTGAIDDRRRAAPAARRSLLESSYEQPGPRTDQIRAALRRCSSTTTSTAACGRPPSSSSPPSRATRSCRRPSRAELRGWFVSAEPRRDLVRYLEGFTHTVGVMQTTDALERVAAECVEDLARRRRRLRRGALRPRAAHRGGLTLEAVVESVLAGFDVGHGAHRGGRPADRRPSAAHRDAHRGAIARDRRARGPVPRRRRCRLRRRRCRGGLSARPLHLDAFQLVQRENFHATLHAGEAFGLPSIWQAIQWCNAERLGHGVRIVDDIVVWPDGEVDARPTGGLRAGPARPPRDVPDLQRAHGAAAVARRAPDRAASPPELPRHGQHRQPAHERRDASRRRWRR